MNKATHRVTLKELFSQCGSMRHVVELTAVYEDSEETILFDTSDTESAIRLASRLVEALEDADVWACVEAVDATDEGLWLGVDAEDEI